MKRTIARSVAGWITVVGTVLLILAAVFFHRTLFEAWYLNELRSQDPRAVKKAAGELGRLESMKGVAALLRLPTPDEASWQDLLETYGVEALQRNAAGALGEVAFAFEEGGAILSARAVALLERIGPAARSEMVTVLRHSGGLTSEQKYRVVDVLSKVLVATPELMVEVVEALKGRDDDASLVVQNVIAFTVRAAPETLPRLLDALGYPSVRMRIKVAETIGALGAQAKSAVPALVTSLTDRSHEVRYAAVRALGGMGADAMAAVPELISALDDQNGHSGREAEQAVPALLSSLADPDAEVRETAATALVYILRGAPDARPRLEAARQSSSRAVRKGVEWVLQALSEAE